MGAGLLAAAGIAAAGSSLAGNIGQWITNKYNFDQQQNVIDWQKEAQKETWKREDTAVQRRAADLQAAGLSKTLAAGSAAQTSSPVSIKAPQLGDFGRISAAGDALQAVLSLQTQQADIAKAKASTGLISAQKDAVKVENTLREEQVDNLKSQESFRDVQQRVALQNIQESIYRIKKIDGELADLNWRHDVGNQELVLKKERQQLQSDILRQQAISLGYNNRLLAHDVDLQTRMPVSSDLTHGAIMAPVTSFLQSSSHVVDDFKQMIRGSK